MHVKDVLIGLHLLGIRTGDSSVLDADDKARFKVIDIEAEE